MIRYIEGNIVTISKNIVIVDVNGVGYGVEVGSLSVSLEEGKEISLYIYTHVRENELKLYGFRSKEELEIFELLLGVNGVGPKAGLSLVSVLGVEEIIRNIMQKEPNKLKVPGIGAKTTNKIILDLYDTLEKLGYSAKTAQRTLGENQSVFDELSEALLALGYSARDVEKALKKLEEEGSFENLDSEQLLKKVLTHI